jgi:hypothetical protein
MVVLGALPEEINGLLELVMCVRDWALASVVHIRGS